MPIVTAPQMDVQPAFQSAQPGCGVFVLAVGVGSVSISILSALPVLGPLIGGFIAGLVAKGTARGMLAGFLSGSLGAMLVAIALAVIGGASGHALGGSSGTVIGGLVGGSIGTALFLGGLYLGVLGLAGGALGGYIRKL